MTAHCRAARASEKSPVEMPFQYNQGISFSILLVLRKYGGKIAELKRTPSHADDGREHGAPEWAQNRYWARPYVRTDNHIELV